MSESRVIAWRPKAAVTPPVTPPSEYRWTMVKEEWQVDCVVQQGGRLGWATRVLINCQLFIRCEFPTWVAAVDAAEIKYGELLRAGWTPGPLARRPGHPV